ncbi:MAG: hypothetical protein BA874_13165 [Desulfuromonadales bacterium C00003068]|nr:MAG: hypothetical protein BA874_13165 [Desulfuromonadales bacterium C00003068]
MQAMPMINQPAVVNEAVAPRATRSSSAKSDDRFSPVLKEACSEGGEDELAGAAMVAQNQDTQQEGVIENPDTGQPNATQNNAKEFVATDEVIAEMSIMEDQVLGEKVLVAEAVTAAGEVNVKTTGADPTQVKDVVPPNAERATEVSQRNQNVIPDRDQPVTERSDLANKVVTQEVAVAPVVVSQVAASTGGAQPLQQLNVLPLQKIVEPGVSSENGLAKGAAGKGKIITDPRFASLLNKPEVGASLRQQQSQDSSLVTMATPSTVETATETTSSLLNSNGAENEPSLTLSADSTGKSDLFGVNMPTTQNVEGGISTATHPQLSTLDAAGTQQSGPAIALKDGSSVPESRVVQQTIDHLTLHSRGDISSVTVKLHPEELGEIQLRMVMEGDQLKVHLQAQSQQVQEVLERNFPRLRDALQEQGVTVDDFQVSVDSGETQ